MNILITGGTGFIGSKIVRTLHRRGHNLHVISRFPNKQLKIDRLNYVEGTRERLKAIYTQNIDATLHLATNYGRENNDDKSLFSTNIELPTIIIEEAVRAKSKYFINADSYYAKYHSDFPHLDKYTSSKREFLKILEGREKDIYGINVILHHVYGRGDGCEKFLPSVIHSLSDGIQPIMKSQCAQSIDIIRVEKVSEAFVRIIENLDKIKNNSVKTIEVGEGVSIQLSMILKHIRKIILNAKREVPEIIFEESSFYPNLSGKVYEADTKILESLGWKRSVNILGALGRYVKNELQLNNSNTNIQ